jgi:hypothetical protein
MASNRLRVSSSVSSGTTISPHHSSVIRLVPWPHNRVWLALASRPRSVDHDLQASQTPLLCVEQRTGRSPALHAAKGKLIGTRQTIALGRLTAHCGAQTTSTLLLLTV